MKKRILSWLMLITLLLPFLGTACTKQGDPAETEGEGSSGSQSSETLEGSFSPSGDISFNGLNFRMSSANDRKLNMDELMELIRLMNVKSIRNPMNLTSLLSSPTEVKEKQVEQQKEWIRALGSHGVTQIVGVGSYWFPWEGSSVNDRSAAPRWSEDEGSAFRKWLKDYETSWNTLAAAFPEVHYWEVGSALNLDENLHPESYTVDGKTFDTDDKIEIILELCYAASKGIHAANPDAVVILPGIRVVKEDFEGAKKLLSRLYWFLAAGNYGGGSTDPNDFFGAVAWQCYPSAVMDAETFVNGNQMLYQVLQEKGEWDKPVFLTELALSDGGKDSTDSWQATLLGELLTAAKEQLSFINAIFPFRMINDDTLFNETDCNYGMFRVLGKNAFEVKEKGKKLAEIYGGRPNELNCFRDVADPVEPDVQPGDTPSSELRLVSYLCTWGRQSKAASSLGINGTGSSEMRDALTADALFYREDLYHIVPREYRSKLIFLLDDGWDVPMGTSQDGSRAEFGAMEPDPEKFGSLGNTALERLTEMCRLTTQRLGYMGMGLWVSPQIPYEGWTATEDARAYWEKAAKLSGDAGVLYWKVDWGKHQADLDYRNMITECAKKFAPDLIVEHVYTQTPFTQSNSEKNFLENRENAIREYVTMDGVIRIYDLSDPFETVCTLDRLDQIFALYEETDSTAECYVNAESQAYIAAVLGCNVGIMSYNSEMEAALIWQQNYAPAFSAKEATYMASEERLTDSYYFDRELTTWFSCANQTIRESAPAIMARGCELPIVKTADGSFTPYVAASINPYTGAASIGAFARTVDPNQEINGLADVTFRVGQIDAPIGVFGMFNSLTLEFDSDLSGGVEVYARDLLSEDGENITPLIKVNGNSITIDGTLLRRIGKSARSDKDSSQPSLVLSVVLRS